MILFKKVFKTLTDLFVLVMSGTSPVCVNMLVSITLVSTCSEAPFARSGRVFVLKQELKMSVWSSARKFPVFLITFGGIWSSHKTSLMLMRFINFNTPVVVSKHFSSEFFLIFDTLGWYLYFSKILSITVKKVTLFLSRALSGFLPSLFSTTFMQALFKNSAILHYLLRLIIV